ncbi:unnamed protein product [Schistosoma bovis]|nr:unnamed protein product [Schistosoma bovis]
MAYNDNTFKVVDSRYCGYGEKTLYEKNLFSLLKAYHNLKSCLMKSFREKNSLTCKLSLSFPAASPFVDVLKLTTLSGSYECLFINSLDFLKQFTLTSQSDHFLNSSLNIILRDYHGEPESTGQLFRLSMGLLSCVCPRSCPSGLYYFPSSNF